jgi:hypothetical protein
MSRLALALLVLAVVACSGSSSGPQGPTASSVAAQPSDVPSGMVRCGLSGSIDSFLDQEKTADAATYQSTKSDWDAARSKGATAAFAAIYTDTAAHCDGIKTSGADVGAATYKVLVNFVIQFKDESSASKAYSNDSFFGIGAADLSHNQTSVTGVEKTGLSANSAVLDTLINKQTYYLAVWQNKSFLVILAVLNADSASAKKVATAENGRIK